MYEVEINTFGQNKKEYRLFDTQKAVEISVLPQFGAILNKYSVNDISIIDGISLDEDGEKEYADTYKSSVLFPFPNRVAEGKYSYENKNYQLDCNEQPNNNSLHGLVYDKHFEVVNIIRTEKEGAITLAYASKPEKGFPFMYKIEITYHLNDRGELTLKAKIKNVGENTFPYGFGWHHYFKLDERVNGLKLKFLPDYVADVDEKLIPNGGVIKVEEINQLIGDAFFDTAFKIKSPKIILSSSTSKIEIDVNSQYPYLQVYTPPHRKSIAIEPMTCLPDVFNNMQGYQELVPTEEKEFSFTVKVV